MAKVTAPDKEFTGKRGQVSFIDGSGETDDPTMLAYFRRHGYKVEGPDGEKSEPKPTRRRARQDSSESDEA